MNRNRMSHIAVGAALLTLLVGACNIGVSFGSGGGGAGSGRAAPWLEITMPSAVRTGVVISPAVQVTMGHWQSYDTDAAYRSVTLAIGPGTGTVGAVLSGTVTKPVVNGVATFPDLAINKAGASYTLLANFGDKASSSAGFVSRPFNVTGPLASVAVSPANSGFTGLGALLQMTAQGRDADNIATADSTFTWTSSDSTKIRVSASGFVTGLAYGTATISAMTGDVSGSASVTAAPISGSFVSLSGGTAHSCGVTTTGAAYCWGNNYWGQLGIGTLLGIGTSYDALPHTRPVAVAGGLTFASLTAGYGHSCGLTSGGAAYCWGENGSGQLGDGSTTLRTTPVAVAGGLTFATVSGGGLHTCGVTTGGAAYCWGFNYYGQLGNGSITNSATPVAVAGGMTFAAVSAGGWHTCGVTTGGAAYCWGDNRNGELGNGSRTNSATPVAVTGGLTLATVSSGGNVTCGVTTGGAAYCWGYNGYGELGNGSLTDSATPVAVAGGLTFANVSAGAQFTCGVTTGGAAYCWGDNGNGELGNGLPGASSTPVAVAGGLTFTAVSARENNTCGVTTGGAAYCWGENGDGELGNGSMTNSAIPVAIAGQPSP